MRLVTAIFVLLATAPFNAQANLGAVEKQVAKVCIDYLSQRGIAYHSFGSSEVRVSQTGS